MILRRTFVGGLATLLVLPLAGRAQPANTHRIGYLVALLLDPASEVNR